MPVCPSRFGSAHPTHDDLFLTSKTEMFKSFASAREVQSQRQKRVRDVCTKILGLEPIDIEKDNPDF